METLMNGLKEHFTDAYVKFTHLFPQVQVREEDPSVRVREKTFDASGTINY